MRYFDSCMAFLFAFFNDSQPQSDNMVANLLQNHFALYAFAGFFLEFYWQTNPSADFLSHYLFKNNWDYFIT